MDDVVKKRLLVLVDEFNEKARINDENAEKVKPTDIYYLGRASSFSDAAKMLQEIIKRPMTVKDLKIILNSFDENLTVTVCDYDDDSDGETVFKTDFGVEQVTINGSEVCSIYLSDSTKN